MKIKYSVRVEGPALTGQPGTIGKDIDIVTKRDGDNLPYFSASHIKGIYRNRVSYMSGVMKDFSVEKFFGEEGENIGKLIFSDLKLEKIHGRKVNSDELRGDTGYLIGERHGIRRDRKTRTTVDGSLFNYEYINPGMEFTGEIEIGGRGEEPTRDELRYLIACLFHIDRIGGQKSRGLGRVKVRVEGKEIEELEDLVNLYLENTAEGRESIKVMNSNKSYRYTLEMKEDVVLKSRKIGNTTETLDYIHGGSIRGAIIEKIARVLPQDTIDTITPKFMVSQGSVEGSFISPSSIFRSKYPVEGRYEFENKLFHDEVGIQGKNGKNIKLERYSSRFVGGRLERKTDVSIAINNATRTAEDGMLYDREILRTAKRTFEGILVVDEGVAEFMDGMEIRIGKHKNKGFGRGTIRLSQRPYENTSLKERIEKLNMRCKLDRKIITIDCLSDIILPFNEVEDLGEEVGELLNIKGAYMGERSYVSVRMLEGYNLINNIRKSDEVLVEKGSVLAYEYTPESLGALRKLEERGIGLRKNEGFGRIEICSENHLKGEY